MQSVFSVLLFNVSFTLFFKFKIIYGHKQQKKERQKNNDFGIVKSKIKRVLYTIYVASLNI